MDFFSKLFLIEINFSRARVIKGFVKTFLNGACTSKIEFILFKKESIERLKFC